MEEKQVIVAMKGHPGTGKSTLAKSIAKSLKCPLLDKDHFRDCSLPLQESLMMTIDPSKAAKLLNDLSYDVIWQAASTQLSLGLSVVVDSPLSRSAHLNRLLELAAPYAARLVIIECKPKDEATWRRRLELRGAADGSSWHKPSTWQQMDELLEGYAGCWDYDVGEVPKLVVDTTAPIGIEEILSLVFEFLGSFTS